MVTFQSSVTLSCKRMSWQHTSAQLGQGKTIFGKEVSHREGEICVPHRGMLHVVPAYPHVFKSYASQCDLCVTKRVSSTQGGCQPSLGRVSTKRRVCVRVNYWVLKCWGCGCHVGEWGVVQTPPPGWGASVTSLGH